MKIKALIAATVTALALSTGAQASQIFTFQATNNNNNPVDATASFTFGANTLQIILTNLQSGITAANQLISALSFTLSPADATLAYVSQAGTLVNANGSPVAGTPTWSLVSGPRVTTLTGGQPSELIIGPSPNCNSSCDNFNPSVNQVLTINLSGANLTAATTVTSVTMNFGTQIGEFTQTCTPGAPGCGGTTGSGTSSTGRTGSGDIPEPSSPALALLGLAILSGTLLRRKMFSGRA